jgi:hypothetical protein
VLAGPHIDDGDEKERVLRQEDQRLMGEIQTGLEVAEAKLLRAAIS